MSLLKAARARFRALIKRTGADAELGEEIQFHIEKETEKNIRFGMSPDEARRMAVAHFGGVQRVREEHRDVRRMQWLEDAGSDVRFALRGFRRSPVLTGAAIITLALGIGANVAIFSAVNAVVLQPLPMAQPDQLMMLWEENPEKGWHEQTAAPANYLDWRAQVPAFADVAAYASWLSRVTLTGRGEPRLLNTARVTGNFFSTLGIRPLHGRMLRDEETWTTAAQAAVLSEREWRTEFKSDPSIIGQTIHLGGDNIQVVGVAPAGFNFPWEDVDVWMSIGWKPAARAQASFRRAHWLRAIARLKPGVTQSQADAQLQSVVERLKTEYPATNRVMGAGMTPLHRFIVGDTRLPLLVLLISVALLLLIACANVGNLLLVKAAGRGREAALRLALGAGRFRLVRQALAESLLLSLIGGLCGLVVGVAGTHVLEGMQPPDMLRVTHFGMDTSVLAYVTLITTMSGVLFGIAPALWARGRDPAEALKDGSRGGGQGRRVKRWGDALVIGEVALALLLTVGAGLLVRSFWGLRHVDGGFDANGVVAVEIGLPAQRYDSTPAATAFWNQMTERTKALGGVSHVAHASSLPLLGVSYTSDFIAAGRPADGYGSEIGRRSVSRDYFATMKVPVLRGRAFDASDRPNSPPVAIINNHLAQTYFRGQDPIGQRISDDKVPTDKSVWRTIVGVVGDERQTALETAPKIEMFNSIDQEPWGSDFLVVRTDGDPAALAPAIRRIARELDPSIMFLSTRTMSDIRGASLAKARFLTTLLLCFAVVGLVLSIVGVYGLLAQLSRNRTREMGIRIALGAQATRVRWLIVRQGLRLTAFGLVIGGVVAIFATRAMTKLLFNVAPNDPVTLGAVALILAGTSILAAWIPALKASRADPATALRAD